MGVKATEQSWQEARVEWLKKRTEGGMYVVVGQAVQEEDEGEARAMEYLALGHERQAVSSEEGGGVSAVAP